MKLGVLFSGGKDSVHALGKAMEREEVVCFITLLSRNLESYMFHTPNIGITSLQAESIGLPIIQQETQGEKEEELKDLRTAILRAIELYGIQGIVTGAIESVYQATRVERICQELGIWCFNPLWKKDQLDLLHDLVDDGYEVIISGIFAFPLTEAWLGRRLNDEMICELRELYTRYQLNPSGEGGELETTVLDAPFFTKRIVIDEASSSARLNSGLMTILDAHLEENHEITTDETEEQRGENAGDRSQGERTDQSGGPVILIVDMNSRPDSLAFPEFVLPIVRCMPPPPHGQSHRIVHYRELTPGHLDDVQGMIFSGTPLMDNDYFNFIQEFTWLRTVNIPMLGICAGMQFLGLIHGSQHVRCLEIGMIPIETIRSTPLLPCPSSSPFSSSPPLYSSPTTPTSPSFTSSSTPSRFSSSSRTTSPVSPTLPFPASSNHLVPCPASSSSTPPPSSASSSASPSSTSPTLSTPPTFSPSLEGYNLHRYSILPSEELIVLARSEGSVQAFGHKKKPIFGVMFHPEVRNPEVIEKFITEYCEYEGR